MSDIEEIDPNADRCPWCRKTRIWKGRHAAAQHPEDWEAFKTTSNGSRAVRLRAGALGGDLRRDTMENDPTQPIQYRGHLVECRECGRLHVQGVACQHSADENFEVKA